MLLLYEKVIELLVLGTAKVAAPLETVKPPPIKAPPDGIVTVPLKLEFPPQYMPPDVILIPFVATVNLSDSVKVPVTAVFPVIVAPPVATVNPPVMLAPPLVAVSPTEVSAPFETVKAPVATVSPPVMLAPRVATVSPPVMLAPPLVAIKLELDIAPVAAKPPVMLTPVDVI